MWTDSSDRGLPVPLLAVSAFNFLPDYAQRMLEGGRSEYIKYFAGFDVRIAQSSDVHVTSGTSRSLADDRAWGANTANNHQFRTDYILRHHSCYDSAHFARVVLRRTDSTLVRVVA